MEIKNATMDDFDLAFDYIEKLWTYNTYDRAVIEKVYKEVLKNENDFAFFLYDDGKPVGFCHGSFFNTFWMSGKTCYIASIITNEDQRTKGYGTALMNHTKTIATEHGCHAMILDTGLPREGAHKFYEKYGFHKCAYCFEYKLD